VAIHARTVAVDVRSVDDGLVFFGLKVPCLGGLHLDLPEAARDIRGVVSGQPSSPLAKPQEPEYLALTLGSGKGLEVPAGTPLPKSAEIQFGQKADSLPDAKAQQRRLEHDVFLVHGGFRVPAVACIGHERGHLLAAAAEGATLAGRWEPHRECSVAVSGDLGAQCCE
jgi:hypothetical protein